MQIGPFDVEPTAWGRTERRREDGRGEGARRRMTRWVYFFNQEQVLMRDLCQQNNMAKLLTDPSRISISIHTSEIKKKMVARCCGCFFYSSHSFCSLAENRMWSRGRVGFREKKWRFYSVYCGIFPQTSEHIINWWWKAMGYNLMDSKLWVLLLIKIPQTKIVSHVVLSFFQELWML